MENVNTREQKLIPATIAILLLYNALYWSAKILGNAGGKVLIGFYDAVKENWWIFFLLEFLGVASVFFDMIVRYDRFPAHKRPWHLILSAGLFFSMVLRLIMGVLEMYHDGHVN